MFSSEDRKARKQRVCCECKLEIDGAIARYVEAKKDIPWVWIQEHQFLTKQLSELVPKP